MRKGGRQQYKNFKTVSGAKLGASSVPVYTCERCHMAQPARPANAKPDACLDCGGLAFYRIDSRGESMRWQQLLMIEKGGKITNLRRQVRFDLLAWRQIDGQVPMAVKWGVYIADFVYQRVDQDGLEIIEDFKSRGVMAPEAKLKLACMEAMGKPVTLTTAI